MSAPIVARIYADTCIACRRKFDKADRVQIVHIVADVVKTANPLQAGAMLAADFEIRHADCNDPQLVKGGVIIR